MKGIYLKDLYLLRQNSRYLLVLCLMYLVLGTVIQNIAMSIGVLVVMGAMFAFSLFSYDEAAKWENYACTLPVTRSQIVTARYAAGLTLLGMGLVAAFLMWGLLSVLPGYEKAPTVVVLASFGGTTAAGLLMMAVMFPICYRFGVERARITLMAMILVPIALGTMAGKLGVPTPSEDTLILILRIAAVAVLLLFVFSWRISCEFYEKKEL